MADLLDMAHSLVADGASPAARADMEDAFAKYGHEWRQTLDAGYRRRTWGMADSDPASMLRLVGGTK